MGAPSGLPVHADHNWHALPVFSRDRAARLTRSKQPNAHQKGQTA